jgi:hypothetical protein
MYMPAGNTWHRRFQAVASAAIGLLVVGGTSTQAHADSTRSQQWYLDAMHAEQMWRTSTGKGITVAARRSSSSDTARTGGTAVG